MMQTLGRLYVSDFNARHRRTGTMWEGRYKSCRSACIAASHREPRKNRLLDS
jgi:hypothetical protein